MSMNRPTDEHKTWGANTQMPKDTPCMSRNVTRHCPIRSLGISSVGYQTCIPCEPICGMLGTAPRPRVTDYC